MKSKIIKTLESAPRLKGREIARKIGVDKTEVNAFLHKHKELFEQDKHYCWSLVQQSTLYIELESRRWIDADSFENSLSIAGSPWGEKCQNVVIVIPAKCSILLEPASRILALCNQLVADGKTVTIDFDKCISARRYLDRAGFFDCLDERCNVLPPRSENSRACIYKGKSENLVELGIIEPSQNQDEELTQNDKTIINQLTETFVAKMDARYEDIASLIFAEFIGNIKRHSQTPLCGIAALQKYGGKNNHIQTIVSDSGLGIATTLKTGLKNFYPDLYTRSNEEGYDMFLVEQALTNGNISRFGDGNGLGFGITTKKAMKFDASLSVRQETFSLKFIYQNHALVDIKRRTNLQRIQGTHLCFDFNID